MNKIYGNNTIAKRIIISICIFIIGILFLNTNKVIANASEINNELTINENVITDEISYSSEEAYLSVHYSDGTMGMVIDETYTNDEVSAASLSYEHLERSTVMSSGKSDNQSIVAVFLGDGFTADEQDVF